MPPKCSFSALKKTGRGWLLTLLVFFCAGFNSTKAQSGTWMYDAIPAGVLGSGGNPYFLDSHYLETYSYYNSIGGYGVDLWYTFTLNDYTELQISTCGSEISTALHVLDQYNNPVAYSDYSGSCGYQAEVVQTFAPGTYYVAVEGSGYTSYSGSIQMFMYAIPSAVQPDGATINNPIVAGTMGSCGGFFSDSRSNGTSGMGDEYGQPNNDIYYQFTLSSASTVTLSHCGSGFDTYMHLLDASGNLIASNDDSALSPCLGSEAFIQMLLPAGTYYVVSEGAGNNTGNIITTINASSPTPIPGANMATAINAGSFNAPGSFTDTRSNADPCLGNDYGQSSNDIYYKFVLNGTADVTLSHCGSGFDTYMHVLDASGNLITSNDDTYVGSTSPCVGSQAFIQTTLSAGTYYLVSEGYSSNTGNIVSTINIIMTALPPLISYAAMPTFAVGTATTLTPANTGGAVCAPGQTFYFAGNGNAGSANGTGTSATLYNPLNSVVDALGNVYVCDAGNHQIRKITPTGVVSAFAGVGYGGYLDGTGTFARFQHPSSIAIDANSNLFVTDQQNHRIRKITPTGVVSTFAGSGSQGSANGMGTGASFNNPMGLAFDASGNLYVGDGGNNKIRKITPAGVVSNFAGTGTAGSANGPALSATFNQPMGLAVDAEGNMYVADRVSRQVRKISTSGVVSTIAGNNTAGYADGTGTAARFVDVNNLVIGNSGDLYVADQGNHMIRKVTPAGVVTTFTGALTPGSTNGPGTAARLNSPFGISRDGSGNMYVAENAGNRIRKLITSPYSISPALPAGLVFDNLTGTISGTPIVASPLTNYTITAYGFGSFASATVAFAVTLPVACITPSQNQNYVLTYTPLVADLTTEAAVVAASCDKMQVQTSIQYVDGLGRPLQTVRVKGNGNGTKDLIQPNAHDPFGRESIKYLPYTTSEGAPGTYRPDALTGSNGYSNSAQKNYFSLPNMDYKDMSSPYEVTVFEPSPLNRSTEQGAEGDVWQPIANNSLGHTQKMEYRANNISLAYGNDGFAVRLYRAASSVVVGHEHERTLSETGYYEANTLNLTISKNENWVSGKPCTTEEYKNNEGKLIAKRVFNLKDGIVETISTYYVYDDFGNLCFVLPANTNPDAGEINQATLDGYCYQYRYDHRNRLIEKRIPGQLNWNSLIYNILDQPILTQDPKQRKSGIWIYSKYDAVGRLIQSGIYSNSLSRAELQTLVNTETVLWEERIGTSDYGNLSFPRDGFEINTVNYYDDYSFPGGTDYNYTGSKMTRGLLTGTKVRVLGTNTMLSSLNFYDEEGRLKKNFKQHYLSGSLNANNYDETELYYYFSGSPKNSFRIHHSGSVLTTITNSYTYDHAGRKILTKESINSPQELVISKLEYNELGQLKTKYLHSADEINFLQHTDYFYNERGWLKRSISNEFSFELKYQDGTTPQYNGNIADQSWAAGPTLSNNFTYTYDALNRLLNGVSTGIVMNEALTYDVMGNIKSLSRDGGLAGTYAYNETKLEQVTNGSSATGIYHYDDNGNADLDGRTGVNLTYNILNLPALATKSGLNLAYTYDATGRKLRKVSNGITRHYIDGIEYDGNVIDVIHTDEGLARNNSGNYKYNYNLMDHLGNVRFSFQQNPITQQLERLQSDDYYPFGKRKSSGSPVSLTNKYLYNGKEIQDELNSNNEDGQYDYGARFYDPVIGRWNVIDPLSEESYAFNPYNYTENNPIKNIDPDGKSTTGTPDGISAGSKETAKYGPISYHNVDDEVWDGGFGQKPGYFVEKEGDPGKPKKFEERRATPEERHEMRVAQLESLRELNKILIIIAMARDLIAAELPNLLTYSSRWFSTKTVTISSEVLAKFAKHAFAKGRHADLGLSMETMLSKASTLVTKNMSKLTSGNNTLHVTVNGIQKTIMVNVENGVVRSMNMYPGISSRVTKETVINLGNVKW